MIIEEGKFKYIESSPGKEVILLLHGLFGALSNFGAIIDKFGEDYNIVVPILPIYEMPIQKLGITGLVKHVEEFIEYKDYGKVNLLGNSLGGHVGIVLTYSRPDLVKTLTLTGSSGLYESAMGNSFPKRGDYDFITKKTQATFYRPEVASKELIDEVYDIVNDRSKGIRVVVTAKSAVRNNIEDKLHLIKCPVLLIWGRKDIVTPAFVGEKFNELLPHSELYLLEECGHAPMMELPEVFNDLLLDFLKRHAN